MSKQPRPLVDVGILTEEEKKAALDRARRALADQWARAELGMSQPEGMTVPQGAAHIADEEQCRITINLAEYCDRIYLDGRPFLHGHTYTVGKRVHDTLAEIVGRTHQHQAQVDGKDDNAYRRKQNNRVSPGGIQ